MTLDELLSELRIPTAPEGHHHTTQGWMQVDCPFCSKDSHHFRLGINRYGLYCSCWSCGAHSLYSFLLESTGESSGRVRELLALLDREVIPREFVLRGKLTLPWGAGPLLPPHEAYLRKRGFDPGHLASFWGIQGIGIAPEGMGWRILIPIHFRGEAVSWTTRSLSETPKGKYKTASPRQESLPHKSLLFGEDHLRHSIIVTEGPFDVFRIGPGAVCTFGLAVTQAQIARIARYPLRMIAFDREPQAQEKASRLCSQLAPFPGKTFQVRFTAKDPGSASPREIQQLREEFLS